MLPAPIRKFVARQEVMVAMVLCWMVLPVVLTLMSFYLGTFVASQHVQDIQGGDIDKGEMGAKLGFFLSMVIAVVATAVVPKMVERDYAAREAALNAHHH